MPVKVPTHGIRRASRWTSGSARRRRRCTSGSGAGMPTDGSVSRGPRDRQQIVSAARRSWFTLGPAGRARQGDEAVRDRHHHHHGRRDRSGEDAPNLRTSCHREHRSDDQHRERGGDGACSSPRGELGGESRIPPQTSSAGRESPLLKLLSKMPGTLMGLRPGLGGSVARARGAGPLRGRSPRIPTPSSSRPCSSREHRGSSTRSRGSARSRSTCRTARR